MCNKFKINFKSLVCVRKKAKGAIVSDSEKDNCVVKNGQVQSKTVKKTIKSSLWLSKQFPLKVNNLITVLDSISPGGGSAINRIKSFLEDDGIGNLF
jgi:hypothetical protein